MMISSTRLTEAARLRGLKEARQSLFELRDTIGSLGRPNGKANNRSAWISTTTLDEISDLLDRIGRDDLAREINKKSIGAENGSTQVSTGLVTFWMCKLDGKVCETRKRPENPPRRRVKSFIDKHGFRCTIESRKELDGCDEF
jgi:hypothetical protein